MILRANFSSETSNSHMSACYEWHVRCLYSEPKGGEETVQCERMSAVICIPLKIDKTAGLLSKPDVFNSNESLPVAAIQSWKTSEEQRPFLSSVIAFWPKLQWTRCSVSKARGSGLHYLKTWKQLSLCSFTAFWPPIHMKISQKCCGYRKQSFWKPFLKKVFSVC